MRSELTYIILISALLIFISTLSPKIINILYSLTLTVFGIGCFFLLYMIRKYPSGNGSTTLKSIQSKIILALLLLALSLFLGWFSYQFILDPNTIACKYSNGCETGPLGWSVSLLLFGLSILTFYISLILAKSAYKK